MSKGLPKAELKRLTVFAEKLAVKAGKILARGFTRSIRVSFKGRIDPVTEYDLKSEKCITEQITKTYPEHAILTEEGSAVGGQSAYRWVIDPLDGTVNYSHGFPFYCVSIGFEYNGEPMLGVVYDPERRELFAAALGQGAFLNGKKIHVSSQRNLERALLATGFAYDIATARKNNLGLFARMAKIVQGIRRPGSAAIDLCWLAAGRIDGFWELDLHPWDTAAATVIIREAGGRISRLNGQRFSITDKDLLASNGHLHKRMKEVLTC
jgi:myo-inositol-1(or 4)-monophosphatase